MALSIKYRWQLDCFEELKRYDGNNIKPLKFEAIVFALEEKKIKKRDRGGNRGTENLS